jgi:hypothetical protein
MSDKHDNGPDVLEHPSKYDSDVGIAGLQQDQIALEARGRSVQEMPKGYYYSPRFLGTYLVSWDSTRRPIPCWLLIGHSSQFHHSEWLFCIGGTSSYDHQRGYRA